jgi:hypothetical protein
MSRYVHYSLINLLNRLLIHVYFGECKFPIVPLHINHSSLHIHSELPILVKIAEVVNFELAKNFLHLNLLLLVYLVDDGVDSIKEIVHFLVDRRAIVADPALLDFRELVLEGGKVVLEVLHYFHYNWPKV